MMSSLNKGEYVKKINDDGDYDAEYDLHATQEFNQNHPDPQSQQQRRTQLIMSGEV